MEYRTLGKSGLKVSSVGLGCNNFGWRIPLEESRKVIHRALDLGISLFDTADFYGKGQSEEFLGESLGPRRKDIVIATKFGLPMSEGEYSGGASRRYIRQAVEASLRRLKTDYIDLYQLHFPDPKTPMVETLRALGELVREGKVRYIGSSNLSGWQLVEADWLAKTEHLEPFISAQNHYNLLERHIERDVVPAAQAYGIGVLPFFPLASGLLTGKYKRGSGPAEGTRLAANADGAKRLLTEKNFELTEKLAGLAAERGKSLLDLAFAWLLGQSAIPSVIAGATKPDQVEANVKAGEWRLSPEDLKATSVITLKLG